jgi:hypothetical protein
MNQSLLTALVGVLSALLGASLQFLYARRGESARHFRELRTRAYADFLSGSAMCSLAQRQANADRELEAMILLTDAKSRIAVYGSAEVTSALADFFAKFGKLNSPAALAAFTAVVARMRIETPGSDKSISAEAISHLLFS